MPESGSSSAFVYVARSDAVYGGLIGAGGKFCLKSKDECSVGSHTTKRFNDLRAGIFLRAGNDNVYCLPTVPSKKLTPKRSVMF